MAICLSPVRTPRLWLFPTCLLAAGFLRAAAFDDRVEALFRPPLAGMIALSPDGQRVAYTAHRGGELSIVILGVEPAGARRTLRIGPDSGTAAAPLRFLRWATPDRLVYAPAEQVVPLPPILDEHGVLRPNPDGPAILSPILVADTDGRERGTLVDARDFQETPAEARRSLADLLRTPKELQATRNEPIRWRMPHLDILGFLPNDREQLILQTRGGYSIPRQHLVDTRTGSVREFGGDWPVPPGEPQVFDPFRLKVVGQRQDAARPTTLWHDDELRTVQQDLDAKFPRRVVELLDWTETRARVLFRVTGGSDPGRLFVYQRAEDLALEILRRAPWLGAARLHPTRFIELDAPDGARLSAYVTWPGNPPPTPPPLLVIFPSGFPGRAQPAFDPEAQVFADLGFVVARLNHRSVAGVRAEDFNRLRSAADRVTVNDARTALAWLAARHPDRPFDRSRVATLGRGFGGYLALRALQLEPTWFHAGIAIDAPLDLPAWLQPPQTRGTPTTTTAVGDIPAGLIDSAGASGKELSVLHQADTLAGPVLLLVEPGRNPAIDVSTTHLRTRLHALGRTADLVELDPAFAAAQAGSRAAVYRRIGEFLHRHLQAGSGMTAVAETVEPATGN
jgi:dipeptidyl aminopeptidase/acylaminoacyl peptidase